MKIVITGAAGLVGSHMARRLAHEHEVTALRHADLDISDRAAVIARLHAIRPELVVNCAVLQVDPAEESPALARAVNTHGPEFLAEAAETLGADIVQFSTQYAFGGEPIGRAPYTIHDEPLPVNAYGVTKVAGEEAVRNRCPRAFIVRTSWVYGSGKQSFLCTVHEDLKHGKRVRVIPDIWSSTTYVADLIDRVLMIHAGGRYGTYHVVNEGLCSYYDFALEAGRLAGLSPERIGALLEVVPEAAMKRVAVRPRYTPLRCIMSEELHLPPMRHWHAALADYVGNRL